MGKKRGLSGDEKVKITSLLAAGKSTLEVAKDLHRDHRTIKVYACDGKITRKTPDRSSTRKITARDMRHLKVSMARKHLATSKAIFEDAGVPSISRKTRCKTLNKLGSVKKPLKQPLLTRMHKEKRVKWAQDNMKTDFSNVIFTDECRATLDGPDGWAYGWVLHGHPQQTRIRRQQGGGGVMFWAGIVGNTLIGPFKVPQGVKLNAERYCELLDEDLIPWLNKQTVTLKRKLIFQHDNAPSHRAKYTTHWLALKGFKQEKIMTWPPASPDLNPIENLWALIKKKVYEGGQQFQSLSNLWNAVKAAANSILPSEIANLTKSVDNRLLKIIQTKGCYVKN
jgi:transposase